VLREYLVQISLQLPRIESMLTPISFAAVQVVFIGSTSLSADRSS
jgi:hypothetical protein